MMRTFGCGHPREAGNLRRTGRGRVRCATCARAAIRTFRSSIKAPSCSSRRNLSSYEEMKTRPPYEGRDLSVETLPAASKALLSAIYLAHPYVFDAALRDPKRARQVVRP